MTEMSLLDQKQMYLQKAAHTCPKNIMTTWCSLGGLGTDQSQARTDREGVTDENEEEGGELTSYIIYIRLTSSVNNPS